jgi:hypothetical protein
MPAIAENTLCRVETEDFHPAFRPGDYAYYGALPLGSDTKPALWRYRAVDAHAA